MIKTHLIHIQSIRLASSIEERKRRSGQREFRSVKEGKAICGIKVHKRDEQGGSPFIL